MRLIELSSNKESFHTISFNPKGISIIAALQETDDQRKTYNSVGKSLSITIVHFCLGSNSNPEFLSKLNDWEFSLTFQISRKTYIATRKINTPEYVTLNDELMLIEEYKMFLRDEVFRLPENSQFLSFRSLITRFIRPKKASYVSYDQFIAEESKNPIQQLVNNGFLLGLDTGRILKKFDLKGELDEVNALKKQLESNQFKSLFQSEKDEDLEITIVELESKVESLRKNLSTFKIAEDYDTVRREADELSTLLKDSKNKASKLTNAITDIEKSLELKSDISKEDIIRLYSEAKIQLGEIVIKKLDELQRFNSQLLANRAKNLSEEKVKFENQLKIVDDNIKRYGIQRDRKMQYLNTHGALDEYTKINKVLSDYESQLEKLTNYKKLLNDYRNKSQEIKKRFNDENIATNKYLEEASPVIRKNIVLFKSFAERFYQEKSSGITVENNEGNNKQRFDIKAKIEDDAGDAVNEVKMFCFDWTLLKGQYNHSVKFLFHDSRITDGVDTRQIRTMFEIAATECEIGNFQYIISLNQNAIDELRGEFSAVEFNDLIQSRIVLSLSDKSPEDKLLGIQLDLNYEQ